MLSSHPYFFANLPLFAAVFVVLILGRRRPLARLALYSGLVCLPCSLLALMHEGYWRPARLGGGPIGVEDPIFTFTTGALVWFCAAWPHRGDLRAPSELLSSRVAKRILLLGLPSEVVLAVLWYAGVDPMSATLLASLPLLTVLLVRRRQLWILAVAGLAFFMPVYYAVVKLQFAIFPGYPLQWNQQGSWAAAFLGLPAGEWAWAAAFAMLWPVVIASAFEVEFRPAGHRKFHQGLPKKTQLRLGA